MIAATNNRRRKASSSFILEITKPTPAATGNASINAGPPSVGISPISASEPAAASTVMASKKLFIVYVCSSVRDFGRSLNVVGQIGPRLSLDQEFIVSAQFFERLRRNSAD